MIEEGSLEDVAVADMVGSGGDNDVVHIQLANRAVNFLVERIALSVAVAKGIEMPGTAAWIIYLCFKIPLNAKNHLVSYLI